MNIPDPAAIVALAPGAVLLRGLAEPMAAILLNEVDAIAAVAPFRQMEVPGGKRMSVAMTSCGPCGWVTDRSGYRYADADPQTGKPWPAMPTALRSLAVAAAQLAGYDRFAPDSCLINRYSPTAKMGLHQDKDEADRDAPIVSVSLGLPATFAFGGTRRTDAVQRLPLSHGDVVVWGGPARMNYHGITSVGAPDLLSPFTTRINLTFRKAR